MDDLVRLPDVPPEVLLTLPATLAELIPEESIAEGGSRSVTIAAGSWHEIAREIAERFPRLAERLLDGSGDIAPGFVLVLGDEIAPDVGSLQLQAGDRIFLIPSLAGG